MQASESAGDWDDYSFVISSKYRTVVIEHLGGEGPATPSKIAAESGEGIAHISRALQSLRDRSLVELLVSEDRKKGRVYGITDDGSGLHEMLQEHGGGV